MNKNELSRRTVLRNGAVLSTAFGLALAVTPGRVAAMNKAELIEQMASEAGLPKDEATAALDGFINATTTALRDGDSVALSGFGAFRPLKRAKRGLDNGSADGSSVGFDACPEFAAGLDLIPGRGDERGARAGSRCRNADVVIDAERLARETQHGRERGLSKADAKRAIEGFTVATTKALKMGDRLSLAGFGSFSISKRSARTGRNPRTGKEIQIAAKNVVKFKAGAELSKAVN
ncbi:HU family DNA-binding protein [Halorubrum ejinorense]|uniref:DNA-binding protein n=1 Tax=Halorubrum ejinorense TaxID=425309 RepID=A0AAV3SQX1_9EURY